MSLITQAAHLYVDGNRGQIVYYRDGKMRRSHAFPAKNMLVVICRCLRLASTISEEEYLALREQIENANLPNGEDQGISDAAILEAITTLGVATAALEVQGAS